MPAVMAAMVESVQKRKTKRGKDFAMAEFSDATGQFSASCFEETMVEPLVRWASENTCVLLNVELDSPSADEPPRITVRGGRPLADVKNAALMELRLDIASVDAVQELAMRLVRDASAQGEVLVNVHADSGEQKLFRLGRDFHLDGELADTLEQIEGLKNVRLNVRRGGGHLRLVS